MKSVRLIIICMLFYISSWSQPAPPPAAPPVMNNYKEQLQKVLANKKDVDFEFSMSGRSPNRFKYYIRNDTLWVDGRNLYATVVPLKSIDFKRTVYFIESSLWKTKNNEKCIEVGLHAIKGKLFGQDFEIADFEKHFGGEKIDFVNLILPNKAFAEEMIKYIKSRIR